jgi:LAO/AO transport system kinase
MQSRILDPGVFIRSMASRGHMGGLSSATGDALIVMDAAGFDVVIIETVGVGQGEVEVAQIADVTIVLMVPGMGDDIQNMKAGIMEIADLFVINKADRPGVDKTEHDLRALVALSSRPDGWEPAIVRTVALEGTGTIETLELITKYRQFVSQSEVQKRANIQKHKNRILELVFQKAQDEIFLNRNADKRIQELAYMVADRKMDPYTAAEEMWNSVTEGPGQDEC